MQKSFMTTMINQRIGMPVKVFEADGSVFVLLEPGMSYDAESVNSETLYARWSEIKWKSDGKVSLIARPGFQEPDRGRWVIKLLNVEGAELEFRTIGGEVKQVSDDDPLKSISTGNVIQHPMKDVVVGGQRVCLPRHIPILVGLTLMDPLVGFQSLTIKRVEIRLKDTQWEGYLTREKVLEDVTEPRPDSELKALGKLLDEVGN